MTAPTKAPVRPAPTPAVVPEPQADIQATMPSESKTIVFTEYRKKIEGTDDYAVYHVTVREGADSGTTGEQSDAVAFARLQWWDTNLFNLGFTQGDSPKKMQYPPRGSGGQQRPPKADIPADGRFQVAAVQVWDYNNGKQIKVVGVSNEEVVDWGGKHLDAFLKTIDPKATQPFMGWADWKAEERHAIPWTTHKLIVQCEPSTKMDKNGKPYWNIKEFVIE